MKAKDLDKEMESLIGAKEAPQRTLLKVKLKDEDYRTITEIAKNNNQTIPETAEILILNNLKRYRELEVKAKKESSKEM